MIFEGKSINDVTDQEISELVSNHISERQQLELKVGIDLKDDENRLELLRDIVSLANGGGGYLIFGIRDDGKGRAQVYDSNYIGDPESLKKTIMSLCHDYITERIDGLEVVSRTVMKYPHVIVHVSTSIRIPHMVKYKNRTDFYTRYNDGKREMTIGEIREAFVNDMVGRRLSIIENMLKNNSKVLQQTGILKDENKNSSHEVKTLFEITDGRLLNETALELFEKEVQQDHYFWLGISPINTKLKLIDVDSPELKNILDNPPDSRVHGWSMSEFFETEYFAEGIALRTRDLWF